MREILYRGKRKDNGEWVEGYYVCLGGKHHYIYTGRLNIVNHSFPEMKHFEVIPETVGQYTGLQDKNGTKIFEGDIIKDTDADEFLVVEGSTSFGFDFRYIFYTEDDAYTTAFDIGISNDNTYLTSAVVIGNIHDDPEMLEV